MSKPRIPIPTIPDFFTPKELCIKAQGREALRAHPGYRASTTSNSERVVQSHTKTRDEGSVWEQL